MSELI